MSKLCEKCGVDLTKKEHRNNCPIKLNRANNSSDDKTSLVINPAMFSGGAVDVSDSSSSSSDNSSGDSGGGGGDGGDGGD